MSKSAAASAWGYVRRQYLLRAVLFASCRYTSATTSTYVHGRAVQNQAALTGVKPTCSLHPAATLGAAALFSRRARRSVPSHGYGLEDRRVGEESGTFDRVRVGFKACTPVRARKLSRRDRAREKRAEELVKIVARSRDHARGSCVEAPHFAAQLFGASCRKGTCRRWSATHHRIQELSFHFSCRGGTCCRNMSNSNPLLC